MPEAQNCVTHRLPLTVVAVIGPTFWTERPRWEELLDSSHSFERTPFSCFLCLASFQESSREWIPLSVAVWIPPETPNIMPLPSPPLNPPPTNSPQAPTTTRNGAAPAGQSKRHTLPSARIHARAATPAQRVPTNWPSTRRCTGVRATAAAAARHMTRT